MGENNWKRIRPLAPFMNEMDSDAINVFFKMRQFVEPCLMTAPVIGRLPIFDKLPALFQPSSRFRLDAPASVSVQAGVEDR